MSFRLLALVVLAIGLPAAGDSVIQSINADKGVVGSPWTAGLVDNVGWTFTATQDFSLTRVETIFGIDESAGPRTVTVELYTAPPGDGGALLGSVDFTPLERVFSGGTFSTPVLLTNGASYFVGFRNVGNLGANVTASGVAESSGNARYSTDGASPLYGMSSGDSPFTAPILQFYGDPTTPTAVPLPTTATASVVLLSALSLARRRRPI